MAKKDCYLCQGGSREVNEADSDGNNTPIICPICNGTGETDG